MLLKGGPRTQILQTKRCLEECGVNVSLFESWKDLRSETIDLIHLFGANVGTYHLAREIHKIGIPFVVTPIFYSRHSAPFVRAVIGVNQALRSAARGLWTDYKFVRDICFWSKSVLPNTFRECRLVEKGLGVPNEKIMMVPNGVEERFYRADPALFNRTYGLENFILNVGHIGPERKNVLKLIQALKRINNPSVIIGRIEDNAYGRSCILEAKKNPRLLILDSLPYDSELLASAYAASDVFALPSQFETPGIAALEAALAGAKIVITKYGGTEEYFGSLAEYVEPTSVELIHHGILAALNREKNSALREHMRQEFLWERVAEKTLHVYERVLSSI